MSRARAGGFRLLCAVAVAGVVMTGRPARGALAPRIANYRIEARYDAGAHTISGRERLEWHNTTPAAAPDLYFHLYLNAFANDRSSFLREAGDQWVDWAKRHPNPWGYISITSIRIAGAAYHVVESGRGKVHVRHR